MMVTVLPDGRVGLRVRDDLGALAGAAQVLVGASKRYSNVADAVGLVPGADDADAHVLVVGSVPLEALDDPRSG